jgi:ribonuclease HII
MVQGLFLKQGDCMSISEIKSAFSQADISEYSTLIDKYKDDDRSGVIKLVEGARKKLGAYEKELERTHRMYHFERKYSDIGYVCGIDEVGRGPLAGPVVAAAVILPKDFEITYLNDSKQLSKKKREELYEVIMDKAVSVGVGMADEKIIDEINILNADYEAMKIAISQLKVQPQLLLNDAVTIPGVDIKQVGIIKGDTLSASIAAASIVAKVTRDRLMEDYDKEYPGYGFAKNMGYGTAEHIEAIRTNGPCRIHRRTFITKFI